jgi:anti-sigma factor RsiW
LRARIEGLIAAEAGRRAAPAGRRALGAAAAASRRSPPAWRCLHAQTRRWTLADQLVASHVRSTLASHLVDVETSDRHVGEALVQRQHRLRPAGARAGRRRLSAGRRAAGLSGRPDGGGAGLSAQPPRHQPLHLAVEAGLAPWPGPTGRGGYSVAHWRSRGLEFWAVSDIDAGDLQHFRKAFEARAPA